MRKEILFAIPIGGYWMLKDSTGFKIGTFQSLEELKAWCKDNGYSVNVRK